MDRGDLLAALLGLLLGLALRPRLGALWRALRPRPRPDSVEQHQRAAQLRALDGSARAGAPLVFYGDSLLHAFELSEWFPRAQAPLLNRAIAGDRTEHLAARLEGSAPSARAAFVLIGGNDHLHAGVRRAPAEVARRVLEIAEQIPSEEPVRVVSLLPVAEPERAARISETNVLLSEQVGARGLRYVDAHAALASPEGRLPDALTYDGVHLRPAGMTVLAGVLAAACSSLGPPALNSGSARVEYEGAPAENRSAS